MTNNIWLVGDDREVVVFDAAHDHAADRRGDQRPPGGGDRAHPRPQRPHQRRRRRCATRSTRRSCCTPTTRCCGTSSGPTTRPTRDLVEGEMLTRRRPRAQRAAHARATPPAAAASTTQARACVFSGDTLFCGGPGATGRSYSDEPTIMRSIRDALLTLPARDDRAHRSRRLHDDRRRASRRPGPRRRTRPLTAVHPRLRRDSRRNGPWSDSLSHNEAVVRP